MDRLLSFYGARKFRRLRVDPYTAKRTFYNNLIECLVWGNEAKLTQQDRRKKKDVKKLQWIIYNDKATSQPLQQYQDIKAHARNEQKVRQQQRQKISQKEWLEICTGRKAE